MGWERIVGYPFNVNSHISGFNGNPEFPFGEQSMKHDWTYNVDPDTNIVDYRKCRNCLIEEMWVQDDDKWIWIGTDDFMNCSVACEDD